MFGYRYFEPCRFDLPDSPPDSYWGTDDDFPMSLNTDKLRASWQNLRDEDGELVEVFA